MGGIRKAKSGSRKNKNNNNNNKNNKTITKQLLKRLIKP